MNELSLVKYSGHGLFRKFFVCFLAHQHDSSSITTLEKGLKLADEKIDEDLKKCNRHIDNI
jgi:hypothetical protein